MNGAQSFELQGIDRPEHSDALAPEGGAGSPGVSSSLLDHSSLSVDPWEDGTLREDVGERWRPKDLDSFFGRIYEYFKERGYFCIVMSRMLNVLALMFVVAFSTFLLAVSSQNSRCAVKLPLSFSACLSHLKYLKFRVC